MIQTPAYHQFENLIRKNNREVVKNPLLIKEGRYEIDYDDFEQKLQNGHVKAIVLCNPHNPTGRVWKRDELQKLIDIAEKYQVLVISDEIHSDIIFSGHSFNSLMSFDYERSISLLGSPAKTFGMHSISNGYIYSGNNELHKQIKELSASMYLDHGNAMSTFSTIAAYEKGGEWVDGMLDYLESTVRWIEQFIQQELPLVKMFRPEGTYQIWFDFSGLELDDDALKALVFEQAEMGLTPGTWFGADSVQFMRINIASPREKIKDSFNKLKDVVNRL